uniref:DNA polymerase delta subunit 3 n=1 Tax=Suricata suricatta TaxID=37032 RepID=A0A673T2E5_SURSU
MADQLYLENIDEFVTDQNKIVTYKWLSYTLGVHVNQAKQMLYDYVERKRKENSGAQLHVTYLVSGSLIQNGHSCHKVAVVREDKLEAVKSKLAVTASIHVYSIQKAMLKDSGPLFNTDYDILKSNLQNCSKGKRVELSDDETKEAENMKKKRRRIKLPESDSSEDEVMPDSPGDYEAESPSPPPPASPPPEPEPPSIKNSNGEKRKRKRVLKSKTFVDDDGCMVTEKVYVSESCTDSEDELKTKTSSVHRPSAMTVKKEPKEERKGPKKGTAALGKANRQVSITGFFQRK